MNPETDELPPAKLQELAQKFEGYCKDKENQISFENDRVEFVYITPKSLGLNNIPPNLQLVVFLRYLVLNNLIHGYNSPMRSEQKGVYLTHDALQQDQTNHLPNNNTIYNRKKLQEMDEYMQELELKFPQKDQLPENSEAIFKNICPTLRKAHYVKISRNHCDALELKSLTTSKKETCELLDLLVEHGIIHSWRTAPQGHPVIRFQENEPEKPDTHVWRERSNIEQDKKFQAENTSL